MGHGGTPEVTRHAVATALAAVPATYVAACIVVAWAWRRRRPEAMTGDLPPVSILKPLHGAEPDLEENLQSFCDQSYGSFEMLCGARTPDDPALDVARRVAAARPGGHVGIIAGGVPRGANQKVNTLAHLAASARHDVLVIADSDIRVGPAYLRHVVAPLADPAVGVVTCLYRGAPTPSLWSRLAALAIDELFLPSVLLSRALGSSAYCSGATIALRRGTLAAIGGFEALAPLLADDYELGRRVRALGLRSVLSRYEVTTTVHEPGIGALLTHELRWMRTIRTVDPIGHAGLVVTYALALSLVAAVVAGPHLWALALAALALMLRTWLHWVLRPAPIDPLESRRAPTYDTFAAWLLPLVLIVRDCMSLAVWAASFVGRRVTWRHEALHVQPDGVLR